MASWSRAMWQSVANRAIRMFGIGSTRIALPLGNRHCRRELKLNCDVFKVNTFVWLSLTAALHQQ
ncbi:hypothetical protein KIN20_009637 [Parelaphostrongylus tenuis]|uniref:Uncharacterized protein n=1 Tax=Parelaphostrongylus tenuis TaxID=148309 RepID=A0AAD5QJR6_PARTN|nr:hypothetical protein KIN20_009637 [Parelaphostrongylus tenuis]